MRPLISVVVSVYNVELYLVKCLESIINQSYQELQILVINDGSTDSSDEICNQYALLDPRISVIHQSNGGISSVRNRGINASLGKYLLFVDSDDYLSLDFIQVLYEAIISSNAQISMGHLQRVGMDGSLLDFKSKRLNKCQYNFTSKAALFAMHDHGYNYSTSFVVVTAKLYESQLFKGVHFPLGKAYDDEFVNYKLLIAATKIVYSPQSIYYYLIRPDSLTHSDYSLSRMDRLSALEERIEVLKSHELRALLSINEYVYFRELLKHIKKLALYFPHEIEIRKNLISTQKHVGMKLLGRWPITPKSHFYIFFSLLNSYLLNFKNRMVV
jgi:glycosyltransferase involved in cell wall biosynthesis